MSRAKTNKLYRTFVKGMITEAGPLTYPENASINESNCVLYRAGNRTRRLGIDYENNFQLSPYSVPKTVFETGQYAVHAFEWQAVDKQAGTFWLVLQIGLTLYFYNLVTGQATTADILPFAVDLTPFITASATTAQAQACETDMASGGGGFGDGCLFVVGRFFEPLFIQYNPLNNTLTATKITVQIRDFIGVPDGLAPDEEPLTLSPAHEYNLMNQGWVDPAQQGGGNLSINFPGNSPSGTTVSGNQPSPITTYFSVIGKYPSNAKQWWLGQVSVPGPDGLPGNHTYAIGAFDPELLNTFYTGNGFAPRGHFVLDAFNQDRNGVSGLTGVPAQPGDVTTGRPNAVSFFSGRVWMACNSTVYYSQVLQSNQWCGWMYQMADPTAQSINELVATDGGYVPIPEAAQIVKLHPFGAGIIVFCTNGVWYVSGTGNGFTSMDIAVTKLSSYGTISPHSVVEDGHFQVYFWGTNGIWQFSHKMGAFGAMLATAIGGAFDKQMISLTTIQTFYANIPDNLKALAHGVYDPNSNVIEWWYSSGAESTNPWYFDSVLRLDLTLEAFYPWTISSTPSQTPFVLAPFQTPFLNTFQPDGTTYAPEVWATYVQYVTAVPVGSTYQFTASTFNNVGFTDWCTFGGAQVGVSGYTYLSFMETGYELFEDAERRKELGYVFVYMKQTEVGWIPSGIGSWTPVHPSSLLMQVKWDWSSTQTSNHWSTKEEVYKIRRWVPPDESLVQPNGELVFDSGYPVTVTKHRVRGRGKALQFRFENQKAGSDFDLKGWAINVTGEQNP